MTASYEAEFSGGTVTISERTRHHGTPQRAYRAKPRVFVDVRDWSGMSDMSRREQIKFMRKGVLAAIAETGILLDLKKMGWDDTAGCSCGCSPGFVLDHSNTVFVNDQVFSFYDIYVSIMEDASSPLASPVSDETHEDLALV